MEADIKCPCCALPIEVDYNNSTNEEGEEYAIVYYVCQKCDMDAELSQWGWIENVSELIDLIKDYLKLK